MKKLRIVASVTLKVVHGRQKMVLEQSKKIQTFAALRVALGTGYCRVEGNRRVIYHPKTLTLRFATFHRCTVGGWVGGWGVHGGRW
jgi:hypothetical protein